MSKTEKKQKIEFKKALKILNAVIFFGACGTFALYLLCINDLSIKGFQIRELTRQTEELKNEQNKLELEAIALGSYQDLDGRIKTLGMVKADTIVYVPKSENVVAKR